MAKLNFRKVVRKYLQIAKKHLKARRLHSLYGASPIIDNQAMFDSFWGRTVGCNSYAIYLQMRSDSRFDGFKYIWVCNDLTSAPKEMRNDPAVKFVTYEGLAYHKALAQSKYLIANSNFPLHFIAHPDQIYVNAWHGTPLKHIGADADDRAIAVANTQRNYFQSDIIVGYSPVATERTVGAHLANDAIGRVREIGTPRIDLTLKATREEIRQRLGVRSNRPVLLYAPTWRGSFGNTNTDLEQQIAQILMFEEKFSDRFEVFVSAHNITAQALRERKTSFRSVPPNIPINEVLAGVDVLVSDYSSIMVDFLVLDRPIILYCYDFETYRVHQGFYFDLRTFPGAFCEEMGDLESALANLSRPSEFEKYEAMLQELCPFEDGLASRRAIDLILDHSEQAMRWGDGRKRILAYPGGMTSNGVTSSIVALSNSLDYNKFDLSLVVTASSVEENAQSKMNLKRLHPKCRIIYRNGSTYYSNSEALAYRRFRSNGQFEDEKERQLLENAFSRESARIFGRQRYDVVMDFSGYGPYWSLVLLNTPAKRKLIFQHNDMHGEAYNPNPVRSFPELPAVFSLYKQFDGIVSVTPEMLQVNKTKLSKYYRPDTEFFASRNLIRGDVILSKAETPLGFVSVKAAAIRAEENTHVFCCVARLSPEKNHKLLLDAFARVVRKHPRTALLILGSGKLQKQLQGQASKLGISDNVVFMGHVNNPYPIMKMCDTKVLSSIYEGQGIVLLEALTLGLRCIATDNPAVRNVLKGGHGELVPMTVEALSAAMIQDVEGKHPASRPFDWAAYAKEAMTEFEICVNGGVANVDSQRGAILAVQGA